MKLTFWLCFALISYAYFGYALGSGSVFACGSVRFPRSIRLQVSRSSWLCVTRRPIYPPSWKNLRLLDYPPDRLQIVIASDGSMDGTAAILREQMPNILPVILETSSGKGCALNEAVKLAQGDILVFLDARQVVDSDAVSELVSCFEDPEIGAVSGELLLETASGSPSEEGLGIYWKIEKTVRKLESASGSVVGVTGAIYAIRRELYTDIPRGTILDDVFVPMNVGAYGEADRISALSDCARPRL